MMPVAFIPLVYETGISTSVPATIKGYINGFIINNASNG